MKPMRRRSRSWRDQPRAPSFEARAVAVDMPSVDPTAEPMTRVDPVPTSSTRIVVRGRLRLALRHLALPAAGLAIIIATAAYVRYVGITQVGFNSDEAVYSGQAAAIAGFQPYGQLFGVFRAHPLLVQFSVALGYAITGHVSDWLPRMITASLGLVMVIICWGIGTVVRGRFLGFAMGMIAALCPYAVLVSRQMLLDGPMTMFVAATMLMLALWLRSHRVIWFYAAAAMAALAVLSKEMAILTVPAVVLFVLFSRDLPLRWRRDLPIAGGVFLVGISPYPLSLILGGGAHTTNNFIVWQFFRQPNHDPSFYLSVIPSLGYLPVALAVAAIRHAGVDTRPLQHRVLPGLADQGLRVPAADSSALRLPGGPRSDGAGRGHSRAGAAFAGRTPRLEMGGFVCPRAHADLYRALRGQAGRRAGSGRHGERDRDRLGSDAGRVRDPDLPGRHRRAGREPADR